MSDEPVNPTNPTSLPEGDDFDSMFDTAPAADLPAGAVQQTVTLRTTTGEARFVVVEGPRTLGEIVALSGLTINGQVTYYMDGVQITPSTVVAPGSTISLVGAIKGGR